MTTIFDMFDTIVDKKPMKRARKRLTASDESVNKYDSIAEKVVDAVWKYRDTLESEFYHEFDSYADLCGVDIDMPLDLRTDSILREYHPQTFKDIVNDAIDKAANDGKQVVSLTVDAQLIAYSPHIPMGDDNPYGIISIGRITGPDDAGDQYIQEEFTKYSVIDGVSMRVIDNSIDAVDDTSITEDDDGYKYDTTYFNFKVEVTFNI